MRRGLLTAVVAAAFSALVGGVAEAATVTHLCCSGVNYTASPGERNTVTWTTDGADPVGAVGLLGSRAQVVISDATAKVVAGPGGCKQLGPRAVLCDDDQGRIYLGDGDDLFSPVASSDWGDRYRGAQFFVDGGPGNDLLVSGGVLSYGASSLYGGDGNDVIIQRGSGGATGGAGNDKIFLAPGYHGGNLSCGSGSDTVIAPKGDPLPADCEKYIQLPAGR